MGIPWWLSAAVNALCGVWFVALAVGFNRTRKAVRELERHIRALELRVPGEVPANFMHRHSCRPASQQVSKLPPPSRDT
jgi:hypothetical protein